MTPTNDAASWELRPVQTDNGRWTVRDEHGYAGCLLDYPTEAEAQAWLDGYEQGVSDNTGT